MRSFWTILYLFILLYCTRVSGESGYLYHPHICVLCVNIARNTHKHQATTQGNYFENMKKFLLKLMGVLATGSMHARPSARPPIDMSRNLQSHLQTSPPTPKNPYPKFWKPKTTFNWFFKNLKQPHTAWKCERWGQKVTNITMILGKCDW